MLTRRILLLLGVLAAGAAPLAALPGVSVLLAILGIGFLIFIHEWGHFMACRLTGTRTETFSIGFGPRLFGWEKDRDGRRRFTTGARQLLPEDHAMDFRVALIPLGGYVKMAGEALGEARTGAPDEFPQKSAGQRAFIISAGILMNLLTAGFFFGICYLAGIPHPAPIIGIVEPGGPAWQAGIEPGAHVHSINGHSIESHIDLLTEAVLLPEGEVVPVRLSSPTGAERTVDVRAAYAADVGRMQLAVGFGLGLQVGEAPESAVIGPDLPAEIAGVPVVGGAEALEVIHAAIQAGRREIPVVVEGKEIVLRPQPLPEGETAPPAGRLGIAAFGQPTVKASRGSAAGLLLAGDTLLAARGPSGATLLHGPRSVSALRFGELPLEGFHVRRRGEEIDVDVRIDDRPRLARFLGDLHLEFPDDGRVLPLPPGTIYLAGDGTVRESSRAPARAAGIKAGDRVVRVGQSDVKTYADMVKALEGVREGDAVDLWVEAEGGRRAVNTIAEAPTLIGRYPLVPVEATPSLEPLSLFPALGRGFSRMVRETLTVFRTIGAFVTGRLAFTDNVAGPITIVTLSKNMADDSLVRFLWFLAYVSVMLAALNILPIPVLDGGHLLFIFIEKIKGRPLSERTMIRFQQVGLVLLLVLMFFAFKNDIERLFRA